MTLNPSSPGLVTGVLLVTCLAAQVGCAPIPVTRTIATEQVTTTTPPPPPPQVITTTTENVVPREHYGTGRRIATAHRSWSPDDSDVEEETTETIIPVVPLPQQTMTRTTTTRSITGN